MSNDWMRGSGLALAGLDAYLEKVGGLYTVRRSHCGQVCLNRRAAHMCTFCLKASHGNWKCCSFPDLNVRTEIRCFSGVAVVLAVPATSNFAYQARTRRYATRHDASFHAPS
jgi:hypothetical protein